MDTWVGPRPPTLPTSRTFSTEAAAYFGFDRARSVDEFEAASALLEVGAANFVAADKDGIALSVHALVPDRGVPSSRPMPWHVVDGLDARNLWTRGFLSDETLPRWHHPDRGYLVSGNNDPWGFLRDGNPENDPWYYGAFYDTGFRAHRMESRIQALYASGKPVARADMEALQDDVSSLLAAELVPRLKAGVDAIGTDPKLDKYKGRTDLLPLAKRLADWDQRMDRDKPEPLIFFGVASFVAKRALEDQLTPLVFDNIEGRAVVIQSAVFNLLADRGPDRAALLPDGEAALLVAALADTADWLAARFPGKDAGGLRMGDFQQVAWTSAYGHRLNGGRSEASGWWETVHVAKAKFFNQGKPIDSPSVFEASIYRMVTGFSDDGTPEATVNLIRGASGEPDSRHFADRQPDWTDGKRTKLPFRRADVDAMTESRVVLMP